MDAHLDATISSENIFRSSSIDAIINNCGLFTWMLLINKRLKSHSLWSFFGWSTTRNFSEGPALRIIHFQKVQGEEGEVIYFPYVVRKIEKPP